VKIAGRTTRFVAVIKMVEKRSFRTWPSRRAPNRQAGLRACIQRFELLEALPCPGMSSVLKLVVRARVFFVLANIILGISVSVSPSLADLIDTTSNDDAPISTESQSPSHGLLIYFFSVYNGQFTEEALAKYYYFVNSYYYPTDPWQKPRDENTMPIRLTPIPTTSRVLPFTRV
jgi:hypothetical protein